MKNIRLIVVALSLLGSVGPTIYGYPPTLVLGLQGGGTVFESPDEAQAALPLASANLLAGWRGAISAGGYLGVAASARLLSYFDTPAFFADAETLVLDAGLPLGRGLVELEGSLDASVMGDGQDPTHLEPRWQAGLRLGGGEVQGTLSYRGSYLFQPKDIEDSLYQGLRLGVEWEPSIRVGLAAGMEVGWEYWPDYHLLDGLGLSTGESRQDVVGGLEIGLDGLAGFFLDWRLAASAGLRWSTANSSALGLEEGSENSLYAGLQAAANWSPHRTVGLQLSGFLRREWYLARAALTALGGDSGDLLRVLTLGLATRADWTPNDRFFLVLEGEAGRSFANDPAEERWNATLHAGVELSF